MRTTDFAVFVAMWNNMQGLETPGLHVGMARWLQGRWAAGRRELLLLAFRNSGKSTLVGLFSAWLLARDPDLRILVLAADQALAEKMVRNVKRVIERHPLTRGLKPRRADQWAADRFTVRRRAELRDPSMLARGIGGNVTGSRADVVICDDVEVPNTCDTAAKRADLRQRLGEIDYVLVPGGLQLYMGTPHTYDSIYAAPGSGPDPAPFLAGFERLERPLVTRAGRSRWPARFPDARIAEIRERSGPNKFNSQMLLEPVNILDSRLDPGRLRAYGGDLVYAERNGEAVLTLGRERLVAAACWWDPAYGAPGGGDASVVACVFTARDGARYLHRVEYLTHDPARAASGAPGTDEASQMCRKVAAFLEDNHLPAVTLETNGLGRFLPGLLRREIAAAGVAAAVVEVTTARAKELRILDAFDAPLAAGNLWAHESVWRTPFVREMRQWQPGGRGRDDGLDAVAGCLLTAPVRLARPALPGNARRPRWQGGAGTYTARTDFAL